MKERNFLHRVSFFKEDDEGTVPHFTIPGQKNLTRIIGETRECTHVTELILSAVPFTIY